MEGQIRVENAPGCDAHWASVGPQLVDEGIRKVRWAWTEETVCLTSEAKPEA